MISAPVSTVFHALIDRAALESWLPPSGMTGRFEHFDARPGGSYRLVLTYDDRAAATSAKTTSDADIVDVRFVDVVTNVRVVQQVDFVSEAPEFAGTMTMTWSVQHLDGGTSVEIVAEGVPVGISAEDHAAGLTSSLDNLAAYVES